MRFLVLGAGMMGRALAYDLIHSADVDAVTLADADPSALRTAAEWLASDRLRTVALDCNDLPAVSALMRDHACAIGAVSYRINEELTRAAIGAGAHFCDLGGNDEIVRRQMTHDAEARARGVTILPNCGLAPGLVNILAVRGAERFSRVDAIRMRVGGLPLHPQPPYNYQLVFSAEGLLNEYSGQSAVLRDARIARVDALTEVEALEFPPPFGRMEAFHTTGGASFLPAHFEGKVRHLDYKTIRYPGHCEKMRALLDAGMADAAPLRVGDRLMTEREQFIQLLQRRIPSSGTDVVLLRVTIDGEIDGDRRTLQFELIDYRDEKHDISAMMRGTSFPTSVIAQQIARGEITERGIIPPEQCVRLNPLLAALRRRGVDIAEQWMDTGEEGAGS